MQKWNTTFARNSISMPNATHLLHDHHRLCEVPRRSYRHDCDHLGSVQTHACSSTACVSPKTQGSDRGTHLPMRTIGQISHRTSCAERSPALQGTQTTSPCHLQSPVSHPSPMTSRSQILQRPKSPDQTMNYTKKVSIRSSVHHTSFQKQKVFKSSVHHTSFQKPKVFKSGVHHKSFQKHKNQVKCPSHVIP